MFRSLRSSSSESRFAAVVYGSIVGCEALVGDTHTMPAGTKPAYVKPISSLVSSIARVAEQIKGRLVLIHTEKLKGGKEKCTAVIVDSDSTKPLKSVLVLEAWSPGDVSHMKKLLDPLHMQVVSITNAKIVPKNKTLVFFDAAIKCAWDIQTKVAAAANDLAFPMRVPALPHMQDASAVKNACMITIVAAITEAGSSQERSMPTGGTKPVANLKVATGATVMAAAFWDSQAQQMGAAKVGQVYRIDWVMLKPEGNGKYSLGSVSATSATLQAGDEAADVSASLADSTAMVSMSTSYSLSYEDKMKKLPCQGDLFALDNIEIFKLVAPRILLLPAVYVLDARGMTADHSSRAWYFGCTQCKKQLDSIGAKLHCPDHGDNTGRKVYSGQLLLADPSHKKEIAVWEEMLRRMTKEFLGHDNLDQEDVLEDLARALRVAEVCVRVGVGHKKNGNVSFDLFDISPQVTAEGCLALYRETNHPFFDGSPGVVPVCCQKVSVNSLGQLIVSQDAATQAVESAKIMVKLIGAPDLQVLENIDGLKVSLKCQCVVCESPCTLFAAGLPTSVLEYTRLLVGSHFSAFVQSVESDGGLPIGYHVELKDPQTLDVELRVFKYQAAQFLLTLARFALAPTAEAQTTDKRTRALEDLMSQVREPVKRLRLSRTLDGDNV